MKYILFPILAILIVIAAPTVTVLLINRKHRIKNWLKVVIIASSSLAIIISSTLIYLSIHYKALDETKAYLESDEVISVNNDKSWYHFDNVLGDENAVIFYGGAKVDVEAYSPLCNEVAHMGIDVYLMKLPFAFPLLDVNAANKLAELNKHPNLYMMGHSLGGMSASLYLSKTNYSYKGIILLASYSTSKLDDSLKCLSIYGSNDLIINKEDYEKNKTNLPKNYKEIIIEGGNHSGFGDYGLQRKDGIPSITNKEQIAITKNNIYNLITQ